jgi:hypothetical protein
MPKKSPAAAFLALNAAALALLLLLMGRHAMSSKWGASQQQQQHKQQQQQQQHKWQLMLKGTAKPLGLQQASTDGNCSAGYLSGSHKVYWQYLEDGFPVLADVTHAEGRMYAVFNLRSGKTPKTRRQLLTLPWNKANWSITLPDLPSLGLPARRVSAHLLAAGKDRQTLTIFTPLPKSLEHTGSLYYVDIHVQLQVSNSIKSKAYMQVPFCTYPLQAAASFHHLVMCTTIEPQQVHLLPEWVAYHELQGAEHFFVHTDGPAAAVVQYLGSFIGAGLVTVVDFHVPLSGSDVWDTQLAIMNSCLLRARGRARWVAIADVDEFFQPMGVSNITVAEFLQRRSDMEHLGVIQVSSVFFGAAADANEQQRLNATGRGLRIAQYVKRRQTHVAQGREKMIANPRACSYLDVHRLAVGGEVWKPDPTKELRLAHYKWPWTNVFLGEDPAQDLGMAAYADAVYGRLAVLNKTWVA